MKSNKNAILDALLTGNIGAKGPNGREVEPFSAFTTNQEFSSVEAALAFMYALRHTQKVYKPEYSVYNPNPSKPTGNFLLPQDLYLFDEGKALLDMSFSEYLRYCKGLVSDKKVPVIGLIFAVDQRDIVRVSAQCLFDDRYSELSTSGHILCLISVSGGTKGKNEQVWDEVSAETGKLFAELFAQRG